MTVRAGLYEEEDARAVADRLRAGGFEAGFARERFAGEDDDEDHPWTVTTSAPSCLVETLVEEYDGWLDGAPAQASARSPALLDLPDGPRRVKGHFREP